jgi:anti-sigma regulatory factor (Ser/Thr protein kinase)
MKPLFNKLLGGKQVEKSEPVSSQPKQPKQQNETSPLTLGSAQDFQRASLIGWVATKLALLMGVELADKVMYLRLTVTKDLPSLDKGSSEEDYILYLAQILVSWLENDEDVYFNIRQMNLKSDYHKNLLVVYELVKSDHSLYFNRKPPEEKEKSEDDKIWEVYRDVLQASSQMKFLLVKEDELLKYKAGSILCSEKIVEKIDIPRARNIAKEALAQEGLSSTTVSSYVLLISEAITNILKHAKDGNLSIVRSASSLNVFIEDRGSGFPLKTLPYTVLMAGYSTKKSLGQGFTLMLKLATKVLLKTSSSGSTIVLVFEENEGEDSGKVTKSS